MWRDLPSEKRAARALIRAGRRARADTQTAKERMQCAQALTDAFAQRLQARPGPPGVLAAFVPLETEPPAEQLAEWAATNGWQVIVPRMMPDKDLTWAGLDADADLGPGAIATAQVIVLPALAVDRLGMRLGQGGGSYDRALTRRRAGCWTVAVVFDDELALRVPQEAHDLPVDAVLTPSHGVLDLPVADPGA